MGLDSHVRLSSNSVFFRIQILLLVVGSVSSFSQNYVRISAELQILETTWEQTDRSTLFTNQWTVPFICIVGTNEWQLDGGFTENGREKWHYNKVNLYQSLQVTSRPTTNKFRPFAPDLDLDLAKSNLTIMIYATPGGYPPSDVSVKIPWLAFCSGTFLKMNGRKIPLPVAPAGGSWDAFDYPDKTETFDDELGLPRRVDLLASRELKDRLVARCELGPRAGFQKFHYVAIESTNFQGWNFPLRFEFAEDIPRNMRGSGTLRTYRGSGRVKAISTSERPKTVFDPTLNKTVIDRRESGLIHSWTQK
jgi:hypothetical protein